MEPEARTALARVRRRYLLAAVPGPMLLTGALLASLIVGDKDTGSGSVYALLIGTHAFTVVGFLFVAYLQWRTPIGWAVGTGLMTFMSCWLAVQFTWTALPLDAVLDYLTIGFVVAAVLAAATGFLAANAVNLLVRQPQTAYPPTKLELLFPTPDGSRFITVGHTWLCPWRRRWGRPKIRIRLERITGAQVIDGPAVRVWTDEGDWEFATGKPAELVEVLRQRCAARLAKRQS